MPSLPIQLPLERSVRLVASRALQSLRTYVTGVALDNTRNGPDAVARKVTANPSRDPAITRPWLGCLGPHDFVYSIRQSRRYKLAGS